jgi:hypothetical protein
MVSSLQQIISESEISDTDDPEERFITSGVSWESYEALLVKLEGNSHYRVTYLDGVLEIVSYHFYMKMHIISLLTAGLVPVSPRLTAWGGLCSFTQNWYHRQLDMKKSNQM